MFRYSIAMPCPMHSCPRPFTLPEAPVPCGRGRADPLWSNPPSAMVSHAGAERKPTFHGVEAIQPLRSQRPLTVAIPVEPVDRPISTPRLVRRAWPPRTIKEPLSAFALPRFHDSDAAGLWQRCRARNVGLFAPLKVASTPETCLYAPAADGERALRLKLKVPVGAIERLRSDLAAALSSVSVPLFHSLSVPPTLSEPLLTTVTMPLPPLLVALPPMDSPAAAGPLRVAAADGDSATRTGEKIRRLQTTSC